LIVCKTKVIKGTTERTVGAALRGRPAWDSIFWQHIDQAIHKEIDSTPGGHGGPPLQYVP